MCVCITRIGGFTNLHSKRPCFLLAIEGLSPLCICMRTCGRVCVCVWVCICMYIYALCYNYKLINAVQKLFVVFCFVFFSTIQLIKLERFSNFLLRLFCLFSSSSSSSPFCFCFSFRGLHLTKMNQ